MKKSLCAGLLLSGFLSGMVNATSFDIEPSMFDFGWVPDNAIVACDFTVANKSNQSITLNSVQPSCGCTATDFTPDSLPSSEVKKINITFNTHGYTGLVFDKTVIVKAGSPEEELTVRIHGAVADPNYQIVPEGDGIVEFTEGSESKKSIGIINKTTSTIALQMVQAPASWVSLDWSKSKIDGGQTIPMSVKVSGSLKENRSTSFTLESSSESSSRLTIVIRTGQPPQPYRQLRSAPRLKPAAPAPSSTPKKKP